jgi:hypothetical protein
MSRLLCSIRTIEGSSSLIWPSELKYTRSISSSMSTSFGKSSKRGSSLRKNKKALIYLATDSISGLLLLNRFADCGTKGLNVANSRLK